ncbi:transposable element Tcb2 transposase [Trichonephila clavipes]|nr:transposable element Tcb2 transposase [Trichonephila clavipes]
MPRHNVSVRKTSMQTSHLWSRVLFTYESHLSIPSDSQRHLIWREVGTPFNLSNITKRDCFGGPGVVICRCSTLNGRTELPVSDRGSIMGDRYCKEMVLFHVRLFRSVIGLDFVFMDGSALCTRLLMFSGYCKAKISLE